MTVEELKAILSKPGCRKANLALAKQLLYDHPQVTGPLPDPQPKRDQAKPLVKAIPRETESLPRIVVRFIGRRVQPLDPDNFAGSVKDLLDGLRHAGLIPEDGYQDVRLITEQERVRSFGEEETLIEITWPAAAS